MKRADLDLAYHTRRAAILRKNLMANLNSILQIEYLWRIQRDISDLKMKPGRESKKGKGKTNHDNAFRKRYQLAQRLSQAIQN